VLSSLPFVLSLSFELWHRERVNRRSRGPTCASVVDRSNRRRMLRSPPNGMYRSVAGYGPVDVPCLTRSSRTLVIRHLSRARPPRRASDEPQDYGRGDGGNGPHGGEEGNARPSYEWKCPRFRQKQLSDGCMFLDRRKSTHTRCICWSSVCFD
jgi:hypothetical protein